MWWSTKFKNLEKTEKDSPVLSWKLSILGRFWNTQILQILCFWFLKYRKPVSFFILIFEIPIITLLLLLFFEIFGTKNSLENQRTIQHWFGPIIMHIICNTMSFKRASKKIWLIWYKHFYLSHVVFFKNISKMPKKKEDETDPNHWLFCYFTSLVLSLIMGNIHHPIFKLTFGQNIFLKNMFKHEDYGMVKPIINKCCSNLHQSVDKFFI